MNFRSNGVDLFNSTIYDGFGYIMNGFIVMDVKHYMYNYDNGCLSLHAFTKNSNVDRNV